MFAVDNTLEAATYLIDAARQAGADEAEVFLRVGPVSAVTLQEGHLSESRGGQTELTLRTWCADRVAILTTTDVTRDGLSGLAKRSVYEARTYGTHLPPLLHSSESSRIYDDPADDSEIAGIEEKADLLEKMVTMAQGEREPLSTIFNLCYTGTSLWTVLVNSRGLTAAYHRQQCKLWVWMEGAGGHLAAAAAGRSFSALSTQAIASHIDACAAFLEQPGDPMPQSGPCEVLLSPLLAADFARSLGSILVADNVLANLRPLLTRIGTAIASPAVTLIDDGSLAGGLNNRPVDDEGTPSKTTMLIEDGKLRELLHTMQSAQKLEVTPNGKATRPGLGQHPRGASTNIYIPQGESTPEALQREIRRGLAVVGVLRPGRIQSATGNFTAVVQGWWVENGEPVRRASGVPITANIFQMLRNVRTRGNDLQFSPLADGAGAPSLLIAQMQVG